MAVQTLFEVHTLKGGQWMVDSTYKDRESAMEVARGLHGERRFDGVKVIRDVFDAATDQAKEFVIYDSSKTPAPKQEAPKPEPSKEAPAAAPKADVDFKSARPRKKVNSSSDYSLALKAVLWLTLILLAGLGVLYALAKTGHQLGKMF